MQIKEEFNSAKDPYGHRYYAKKKRIEFEAFKRTKVFSAWKIKQLRIQRDKCAYCEILLTLTNIVTHIDHVQPLYYDGKNTLDNLVLACRRCNMRKWISNRYVVPEWIKKNKQYDEERERLNKARAEQDVLMKKLIVENMQEQIAHNLSWIQS